MDLRGGCPSELKGTHRVSASLPIQQGRNGYMPCADGVLASHSTPGTVPSIEPGPHSALGAKEGMAEPVRVMVPWRERQDSSKPVSSPIYSFTRSGHCRKYACVCVQNNVHGCVWV